MKKYYPILLAKAGEFKGLSMLLVNVKQEICPVIQLLPGSLERAESELLNHWTFIDNAVCLDFSYFGDLPARDIYNYFKRLITRGVNTIPVVDGRSSAAYLRAVGKLKTDFDIHIAIRASNMAGGLANFNAYCTHIMTSIGNAPIETILMIDLGYAEQRNYNILASLAINIIGSIPDENWLDIVLASGAFPVDVSNIQANTVARLRRFEWDIWSTVSSDPACAGIKYGDFGNKNPEYVPSGNFPGSCSIKYTTQNEFVIYRGLRAGDSPLGNEQFIGFADQLIKTSDYSGINFSWGDGEIHRIANEPVPGKKAKPGSPTSWVSITQNHHITLLESLL